MTAPAPPDMLDARAAAAKVVALFDPGIVLLYGSVFLGTATGRSDIDLCVVFDDLGDYSTRHELVASANVCATAAACYPVDVRVTDRVEWVALAACESTFERYIADYCTVLYERPARRVDWGKKLPADPTDAGRCNLSMDTLRILANDIRDLTGRRGDGPGMTPHGRLLLCETASMAMTSAVVGLNHALARSHPQKAPTFAALIDAVAGGDPAHRRLVDALHGTGTGHLPMWQTGCEPPSTYTAGLVRTALTIGEISAARVGELLPGCRSAASARRAARRAARRHNRCFDPAGQRRRHRHPRGSGVHNI